MGSGRAEALCIRMVILAANEQEWARGPIWSTSRIMRHKDLEVVGRLDFGKFVVEAGVVVKNWMGPL